MKRKSNKPRPPMDSPEFEPWLLERARERHERMFPDGFQPNDFEDGGLLVGDINDLGKSDAELFPDELEEYTPEERRRLFKLHKNEDK